MTDAFTPVPSSWNTSEVVLETAYVNVDALDAGLQEFCVMAGAEHAALFSSPLVITSGNDGKHVPGSAHGKNEAVDLRCHDLTATEQFLFYLCMERLQLSCGVVILDERYTKSPHWHVQTAASIGG